MAISGIEAGSSQEAPPGDLDPEYSGNIWSTVTKLCNIAQLVFGLLIFMLQVAWLGLGDLRIIGLLWVGPLVLASGSLNLNKRCTSLHLQKATTIAAVLSPLSIVITLMFATISGIHDRVSADVFMLSGSLVVVCFVAVPVSLLSSTDTWVLLTGTAGQLLGAHVKQVKPSGHIKPPPPEQTPRPAHTAQPSAHTPPPPVEETGTTALTTDVPPTVEDLNHAAIARPSSDGYEKPIPTRRPRRFRKPKQIPTGVDGTRRALPDVPCETSNDSEDDSEEEFILSEGYMTPSCEVRNTAHASTSPQVTSQPANIVTSQCGAKTLAPKLKPLSKKSSALPASQQPLGEIVEYNEIPSSTEDAVYSESMAIKRIKPSSKIEPYSVSEVITGMPVEISNHPERVECPAKPSFPDRGDQGGSPEGVACRVTEVTQEFGVRMIVTRQEVRDEQSYEEINDTDDNERHASVHDQEQVDVSQTDRDSGYLEPSSSPKKGSFLNVTHPVSTTKEAVQPSCEQNLGEERPHTDGDKNSTVDSGSSKDTSYTHLQSDDMPTTASHAYQKLVASGEQLK